MLSFQTLLDQTVSQWDFANVDDKPIVGWALYGVLLGKLIDLERAAIFLADHAGIFYLVFVEWRVLRVWFFFAW